MGELREPEHELNHFLFFVHGARIISGRVCAPFFSAGGVRDCPEGGGEGGVMDVPGRVRFERLGCFVRKYEEIDFLFSICETVLTKGA